MRAYIFRNFNSNRLIHAILSVTFISALFFPSVRLTSSFAIRLDDLILLVFTPFLLLLLTSYRSDSVKINLFLRVCFILITYISFSCIYGYLFLSVPFATGDLNEILRLSKLLLVIALISISDVHHLQVRLENIIILGSLYIICLGILQFLNPFGVGDRLALIYGEHHAETMIGASSEKKRVILSGAGPNDGAVIALLLYIYMLFYSFNSKRKKHFLICMGLFVSILLTSSRTTLVATMLISAILFLRYAPYTYKLLLVLFSFLVILYVLPYFQYIYIGFQLAFEGTNTSMLYRFEKWDEAFELWKQSKLFGWGIAKSIHNTIVDSEYLLTLRRFGIVGFLLLLSFLLFPLLNPTKCHGALCRSVKYIAISALVIMATNNFFNSYQVITAYVMLVALSQRPSAPEHFKKRKIKNG